MGSNIIAGVASRVHILIHIARGGEGDRGGRRTRYRWRLERGRACLV